MTISAAVSILEKNKPCRADRPGALCRWIAFTHGRALFMYADHISKHHTPSSLPSMRPYGIVKAIRTSSPPQRVRIGAAAVATDEPLPSPLTLDVLFVCLPSYTVLLGIKIGYCAKLQTSCNSPFSFLYCDRTPSL